MQIIFKDFGNKDVVEYKAKADILTHNMLTLLPPLLVVSNKEVHHEFHKEFYDVFRQTWDETKDMCCVYYYRPALVFGNQHSVAVKGLIGNCEQTLILEEPNSNQELVEKVCFEECYILVKCYSRKQYPNSLSHTK